MKSLEDLRKIQNDETASDQDRLAAAMEIANFMVVYSEEFDMLLRLEANTDVAHFKATHDPKGIDQTYRLHLEALQTNIKARKALLDMQMRAILNSEIGIEGPDKPTIDRVKALTAKVASAILKDKAIKGILSALGEITSIVDASMEDK